MILTLVCKGVTMISTMVAIYAVLGMLALWLVILSFFVYKVQKHYTKLVKRTKKQKIDEILEVLLDAQEKLGKDLNTVEKEFEKLKENAKLHYQKVGFLRFSPFERVGGEQSFVVALLDSEDNGIVLNYIYMRDGVRVYAKRVKKGKSSEYALSDEEEEAIKKAK